MASSSSALIYDLLYFIDICNQLDAGKLLGKLLFEKRPLECQRELPVCSSETWGSVGRVSNYRAEEARRISGPGMESKGRPGQANCAQTSKTWDSEGRVSAAGVEWALAGI